MTEPRLSVEVSLPMCWQLPVVPLDAATARGNLLLLHTLNVMESSHPEASSDRTLERLEAKLDLTLHWLARSLHAGTAVPENRLLRLEPEGLAWREDPDIRIGSPILVSLYPSPVFQVPLELGAELVSTEGGWARVRLQNLDTDCQEEWTQWVFRMHRRMIQAARR